ncbi:stress-responsive transcription factor hsf1 [Kappamyces sp. JEL0680]|nr:stress-responsive transcription factor hsf1 [Kappamyces sp. JEL0680]
MLHLPSQPNTLIDPFLQGASALNPSVADAAEDARPSDDKKEKKKTVPAFLNKLYSMVDDKDTDDMIHWRDDGFAFRVPKPEQLAKSVLPLYFKHNNFTSFIRQLNMYGFHKVQHIATGSLAGSSTDVLEFEHECFVRGKQDLLLKIDRRKSQKEEDGETGSALLKKESESMHLSLLLEEITNIKRQQLALSAEISAMQRQNQQMWASSMTLQAQYNTQRETIDKILGFLASVFSKKAKVDNSPQQAPGKEVARKMLDLPQGLFDFEMQSNPFADFSKHISTLLPPNSNPYSSAFSVSEWNPAEKAQTVAEDIDLLGDRIYDISQQVGLGDSPPRTAAAPNEDFLGFLNSNSADKSHGDLMELMEQGGALSSFDTTFNDTASAAGSAAFESSANSSASAVPSDKKDELDFDTFFKDDEDE